MKGLKILPGAAGIIALTATMGFVDGSRFDEGENISRGRISLVQSIENGKNKVLLTERKAHPNLAYLVEIKRGDSVVEVRINATTGRLLS